MASWLASGIVDSRTREVIVPLYSPPVGCSVVVEPYQVIMTEERIMKNIIEEPVIPVLQAELLVLLVLSDE
ncbi:hypothetical protein WISP_128224 [Willisornis vidua]|uniref:Uncharacterized protein n=1 Tax=Willisornis vidua TaxID=1566151 RepID=A0ABQ9CQ46_9PASS|nr:hypothetical protein WISP_128224 [Willisornis vidua]